MQFSCNQDTFSKYLNIVSRIVNSKPGLPILNNVLVSASKSKVKLIATDLEIGINTWIGAEVQGEGTVTIPAKHLAEYINSIPSEKVDVVLKNNVLSVSTVNNNADFHTMPSDDFPNVVTVDGESSLLEMKATELVKAINRVAFAAASDDVKPVLTGIRIEIDKSTISFVAADGLRLSKQTLKIKQGVDEPVNLLVPVKAMQELSHVVNEMSEDKDDMVSIFLIEDRNQIVFRFKDIDLVSRLIDGQYPEYRAIIPTGYKTKSVVSKSDMSNSLKVTNIIARSVLGNKVILDVKDNSITLSASQNDVGSNTSVFSANIEGEDLKIAFSARFLNDMLNNIGGDTIVFEATEPVKPGVFKIEGDDDFIHLIMPMML